MPRLKVLDPGQAHPSAGQLLGDIVQRRGDAGAMVRATANSPALLQGYLDLSRAAKHIKIARALAEKVSLAAHTDAARAAGLTDADIELLAGLGVEPAETQLT